MQMGVRISFAELAAELVRRKPDIIVAFSTTAARPAKQETGTIPIVAVAMADPVADELVTSLARPGGNVTGTTFLGPELVSKRLQLLRTLPCGGPLAPQCIQRTHDGTVRNEIEPNRLQACGASSRAHKAGSPRITIQPGCGRSTSPGSMSGMWKRSHG